MATIEARNQDLLQRSAKPLPNESFHQLVSTENLMFLKGSEWQSIPLELREQYVEWAFYYWRERGFPYYELTKSQIQRQFQQLAAVPSDKMFLPNDEIQWSNVGLALANYYHPQMWSIKSDTYLSPLECFNDDNVLRTCIRRALQIWPDRYGANASNMRRMLSSFTNAKRVSNFRPTVAKAIYQRHSPQQGRVLDFCAGFGGRLLGCLTLRRHYVGYEPSKSQFSGLQRMYRTIHDLNLTSCEVELRLECAEEAICEEPSRSFDLVLTSPPYFNRERYSSDSNQSYVRYDSYQTWREHFLHKLIAESWRVLCKRGKLALNVANTEHVPLAKDTLTLAKPYFDLLTTYWVRLGRLPYRCGRDTGTYHYEPVFLFVKKGGGIC